MAMQGLTVKQERYVQNLFKGMTQRQAYKDAYDCKRQSDKSVDEEACKLLSNPKVAQRLKELQEEVKNRNVLTVEWVLNNLKEIAERCMQTVPVLDKDGEPTGEYKFEHTGANKSLELIGRSLSMFTDKTDTTVKGDLTITVEGKAKEWAK